MTETTQLEHLMNAKASMESEGRELEEQQKQLKLKAKTLTEKIIQELKKRNAAKQEVVKKLQSRVNDLESELNQLQAPDVPLVVNKDAESDKEMEEAVESLEEQMEQAIDDSVSVAEVAEEIEVSRDSKDKRKRKFF